MQTQIQKTATTNLDAMNYAKTMKIQRGEWTIESLGIALDENSLFTKQDFEKDLRKVSRKVKK